MKQIKIKISPDGRIEAETFGMKGKQCLKYIAEMERLANAVCDDSEFTKEYYETPEILTQETEQEVTA
ncbi:MAG: DUF2997 domain-containing protein [Eubacterium sp.]|nr:DUF2997 domain-containing protein [Eubacterium sp.]